MTDRELMQQALDALDSDNPDIQLRTAIALRERLAQPEDWQYVQKLNSFSYSRPWVGLTKEEAKEISLANRPYVIDMIAALEARLKEKNTHERND
jgi:hypothetical protein